ncbi:hypothetical protein C0J52_21486 [Blattella germanica]|nr:hypothetical protein C0J52_21486 [Blattella germanica]
MQHKNTIKSVTNQKSVTAFITALCQLSIFNLSEARYRYVTKFVILPPKALVTVERNSNIQCLEI